MLARPYSFRDAPGLDKLIRHATVTDSKLDEIYVVGNVGVPRGVLVYRPGAFIHELEVGQDFRRRARADALANYAVSHAVSKLHTLKSAIFLVRKDNEAMKRWCESIGAIQESEPGDTIYTLTPL